METKTQTKPQNPVTPKETPMDPKTPTKAQKPKVAPKAPALKFDMPVASQKKSFTLKDSTIKTLADYAAYVSAQVGQKIEEDHVLERIISDLAGDRGLKAWRKESGHA